MRAFLLGVLLALLIVPGVPAQAQDRDFDVDIFHEELAPYGDWFEHPRWGLVWQPRVESDWRPYTQGYWTLTEEYGWYWVADEPWGWAVFHYGRWTYDEDDGWLWIPDTEWGPAWVAWRWSDDHVGWAPLGPGSSWSPDGDLRYDADFYEGPSYLFAWSFVHPRYLTTPGLHRHFAPRGEHAFILRRTRHVHGYRRHDRRVFNAGFDVRRFERAIGRPATRVRLKTVDNPRELGSRRDRDRGGPDLHVFMPRIISRPDGPKRPPQLKMRPESRKDRQGPSFTGFPQGQSGDPPRKDGFKGPSPRDFQRPSGDPPPPFKQTTTPPPRDEKGLPSDVQKQLKQATPPPPATGTGLPPGREREPFKQTTTPPPTREKVPPPDIQKQLKEASPPGPPAFKGQDARPRDGGNVGQRVQQGPRQEGRPPAAASGTPQPPPKGPPPSKKDDKDKDKDKKGGEVR